MRLRLRRQQFEKELPGADCLFQPPELGEYSDDAWDIRVSIGEAPLDEAFYITVEDPAAVSRPIGELVESYVLNPALRDQLDIADNPDLPFMQEELMQYRENEKQGLLTVEYFVNHNPEPGPVDLHSQAAGFMGVCRYHDGAHDYRLLDLVLVPTVPDPSTFEEERMGRDLGRVFLLRLIGYHDAAGPDAFRALGQHTLMAEYVGAGQGGGHFRFCTAMRRLETEGLIRRTTPDGKHELTLTDKGREAIRELDEEAARLGREYDLFDSVGIAPPALGIPDGFDVRVQMMSYNDIDCPRSVLLRVLDMVPEDYLAGDVWQDAYEASTFIHVVLEALAYKTNFSCEVLDALKQLAGSVS
jgi:DNA-binding MarR family transcriptional regulator